MLLGRNVTPLPEKTRLCQAKSPKAKSPGKEAGPLGALTLGPAVAQEETLQTKGHVERTHVENCEAQDPGCLGRIPSKLVKLGKAGGGVKEVSESEDRRTPSPGALNTPWASHPTDVDLPIQITKASHPPRRANLKGGKKCIQDLENL